MNKKVHIKILFFFLLIQVGFSQESNNKLQELNIKLKIIDKSNNESIKDADVQVNGRYFMYHNVTDNYVIKARIGDDLTVSHPDFETINYNIKSDDEIKIFVEDLKEEKKKEKSLNLPQQKKDIKNKKQKKYSYRKERKPDFYHQYLDSAKLYKNIDIDKSLSFIEKILQNNKDNKRLGDSYKVLADIYMFWKQYDLAISNYTNSLNYFYKSSIEIQLASANFLHKDYETSKRIYNKLLLLKNRLSNEENVIVREGLGDVYIALKKYTEAKINYNSALIIAEKNQIIFKVTDLNSKIAEVYALEGKVSKAKEYYKKSLELAAKEGKARSLLEQEKVANFYNNNGFFDDEIRLRKKSLKDVLTINDTILIKGSTSNKILGSLTSIINNNWFFKTAIRGDTLMLSETPITLQSINYKIGRAYVQKEAYNKSIPYLKKSIEEAKKRKDIVVQKDATRKLSEVYENIDKYVEALKTYEDYVKLIDTIYIRKQQEIAQLQRFNKKIAENQNRISSLEKDRALNESKVNLANKDKQLAEEINKRQLNLIYTLIFGIILLILLAYLQVRNNKQQKRANNQLALKSMRSQMNPHFIFNALNSVNSFIAENDERNANRYLSEFSTLMRTVLENSDEDFIPITKEIELLELYVKLEHNRFKDKFDYSILIDSNINVNDFIIPPMLLQPYIENAIWHGLRYKKEKGNLLISMEQKDEETILICIEDDGIGREKSKKLKTENQLKRKSKGMINIKNRVDILNNIYEDRISVNVTNLFENGEGTKVELLLKRA